MADDRGFEVGNTVARKGKGGRRPGEVVSIRPEGVYRIAVKYPDRPTVAYYADDELELVR